MSRKLVKAGGVLGRPGTLFRGLLLSKFIDKPLREAFYESNKLCGIHVGDQTNSLILRQKIVDGARILT